VTLDQEDINAIAKAIVEQLTRPERERSYAAMMKKKDYKALRDSVLLNTGGHGKIMDKESARPAVPCSHVLKGEGGRCRHL